MVKYKVRLTNSFQTGCQKLQSTRKMLLPGISRELHGTQPSISSPLAVDCAEVGCWLLPVSYLVATLVPSTIKLVWFYIGLFLFVLVFESPKSVNALKRRLQQKLVIYSKRIQHIFLHFESVLHMLHSLHTDNDSCTAHAPEPKCPKPL